MEPSFIVSQRGDTPITTRKVSSGIYRSGDLSTARTAVLDDLGASIPQIPLDKMLENILPPLHQEIDILKTMVNLLEGKHLDKNYGWTSFTTPPADNLAVEEQAFLPLKDVITAIQDCASFKGARQGPTLVYVPCGSKTPPSERENSSKPDGFFGLHQDHEICTSIISHKQKRDVWKDMCCPKEFKKRTNLRNLNDNTEKIIWSMQQIMRNDPRRRFTFGITMENTSTRVWFCSREVVLVTEEFNFMKDCIRFCELILSLTFASTSQLGWDPSMKLCWDKEWYYHITVFKANMEKKEEHSVYRTLKVLTDAPADALRGQCTRVFEGYPIDTNGNQIGEKTFAIKDYWLDENRESGAEIMEKILKDATPDEKNYFTTISVDGPVWVDDEIDHTQHLITRGFDVPRSGVKWAKGTFLLPVAQRRVTKAATQSTGPTENNNYNYKNTVATYHFSAKYHRRSVFSEVGKTIDEVNSLQEILRALIRVIKALDIMYRRGYVHRDISPGNILLVDGKAKLSDMEYAKLVDVNDDQHDVRTGTLDFMAAEVEYQTYLFLPAFNATATRPLPPPIPFRHNPIHDLESIWRVALWTLFWKVVDKPPGAESYPQSSEAISKQLATAKVMFPQAIHNRRPNDLVSGSEYYKDLTHSANIVRYINNVGGCLHASYGKAYVKIYDQGVNKSAFDSVHKDITDIFGQALEHCTTLPLCSIVDAWNHYDKKEKEKEEKEKKEHMHDVEVSFMEKIEEYLATEKRTREQQSSQEDSPPTKHPRIF